MLKGLIRLARPQHWIKNVFVLLPVPFAVAAHHFTLDVEAFVFGFVGFCLVNSAIYVLNDLHDAAADRLHPKKSKRPIASGEVSKNAAIAWIFILLLTGIGLCLLAGKPAVMAIVAAYVVINVAYNVGAKNVALLDVFLLASGFVLRVLLGCVLVSAAPSSWLLLCTSTLALFLGFAKRRADLKAGLDHHHRPSLRGYSLSYLDHAMVICAGVAMLSYALYCIESAVLLDARKMASMPFVAYGILNYLRMVDVHDIGASPVHVAYHSRTTQLCAVGWLAAVTWSMGMW